MIWEPRNRCSRALLLATTARRPCPAARPAAIQSWLAGVEREAAAEGISQRAIAEATPYLTYDQRIVNIDRGQRVFTQTSCNSPTAWPPPIASPAAQALIKKYAPVFARIEKQYGVPAPVIVAFWGLESDFGANMGKYRLAQLHRLARLRLPARRQIPPAAARRAAADPARRSHARRDDRFLGRRTRPDADDAVGILQIRGRL